MTTKALAKIPGITALILSLCATASAQSSDALLNKLVEKGILSAKEADDLREEADKDSNKPYPEKTTMPEWVSTWNFNGDFRARYDGIYSDIPGFTDRHRARFRLRFGATVSLKDQFEVGLRLASSTSTGGDDEGDPISTNQTLGNNANRKAVGIDLAYVKWSPIDTPEWSGSFAFGKFQNPYSMSEMVFDNDYTPEGLSQQFKYKFNDRQSLSLNFGQFVLDELESSSRDAFMVGGQARLDSAWNDKWNSSVSVAGLSILNPETLTSDEVPNINLGNTRTATGVLVHDYNLLILDAEITYQLESAPLYEGTFPISFGGEYIYNFGASQKNRAFAFGPTFGQSGKKGTWEFSIKYKELPADAVYEETVDSDYGAFYTGRPIYEPASETFPAFHAGVNVRGPVFRFSYSPRDYLTFSAMYTYTELIDEVPRDSESDGSRLVVDGVWKF